MAEASTSSSTEHVEEKNEDPVKMEQPFQVERYTKKSGGANMAGELYEMKLAALLFVRCLIKGQPFKIATNMNAAGSFDDIVMGLSDQLPVLIQLKHRSGQTKAVYDNQFTQLKGDFALLKYCETYSSLKEKWALDLHCCGIFEKCVFVLYTNARVACLRQPINEQKENCKLKEQDINSQTANTWQTMLNTGGNFCPLLRDTHPKLYEMFENVPRYKRILKERNNKDELLNVVKALANKDAKEVPSNAELDALAGELEKLKGVDCYEEFLSQVWIFGSQASEQKLNLLIENDLKELLGGTCPKIVKDALLEKVQKWWQYDNCFLNEVSRLWQDILEARWKELSSAMISRFIPMIEFDFDEIKRLKTVLSKKKKVIHVAAADWSILTCMKVFECLKENKRIIVDRETFKRHESEIMSYSRHHISLLLFREDDDVPFYLQSIIDMKLEEGNWRVIIISKYIHTWDKITDTFNLSQLQKNSREIILEKLVYYRGKAVPLKDVVGEDDIRTSAISGKILMELLNEKRILAIGNPPIILNVS